jgi:hypothetical protein
MSSRYKKYWHENYSSLRTAYSCDGQQLVIKIWTILS